MEYRYNVVCDVCGFKYKNYELRRRWDGKMVCDRDFETRHPQDILRPHRTEKPIPWARPRPPDIDIDVDYIAETVGTQETTIPSGTFTQSHDA